METLASICDFLVGGLINIFLLLCAVAVVIGAAWFISTRTSEITLKGHSSRFVSLCIIASTYYVVEPLIVPLATIFVDIPDAGLLETGRTAISLAFLTGFICFLFSLYKNRDDEVFSVVRATPVLLIPVGLLVIANLALVAI